PLFQMCHDRITAVMQAFARHGNIVMLEGLAGRVYRVNEPEAVQELLVASHRDVRKDTGHQLFLRPVLRNGLLLNEGPSHLKQRRMMQPAFHAGRIAGYVKTLVSFADRAMERWEEGGRIDAMGEMMSLALDI